MIESYKLSSPTTLVIEYKSESLIIRGALSIIITIPIIALLILTEFLQNTLLIIALGSLLILSILQIKKALKPSALLISDNGMKFKDKNDMPWDNITRFYIKKILTEDGEQQKLIINTTQKDFEFDISELEVESKRLDLWLTFYRERKSIITSHLQNQLK